MSIINIFTKSKKEGGEKEMKKLLGLFLGLLFVATMATGAQAYTIVPGGSGMTGFYGWEDYNYNSPQGGIMDADVFFAVFAPGDTTNPLGVNATEYTYTYLITNYVTANPLPVSSFTVGILPDVSITGVGATTVASDVWDGVGLPSDPDETSGDVPLLAYASSSSVVWTGWEISQGSSSEVLYYTSPFGPTFVSSALVDGGFPTSGTVPGPVTPEPASLMLLGSGLLGLAAAGFKRKNRVA